MEVRKGVITNYMRSKYYPIFIWWKLSTIIPIRPIELVKIKNNDIRYDEKEEKYYLTKGKRKLPPSEKEKGKYNVVRNVSFNHLNNIYAKLTYKRLETNSFIIHYPPKLKIEAQK